MDNIFSLIKNSSYIDISVPFDNENEEYIRGIVKELEVHGIIDISIDNYATLSVKKKPLFDEIVLNYDSNFGKWLDNKKEKERQVEYKNMLEIEKSEREIERLKYERTNQELDKTIRILTAKNLRLQNFQIIYGLAAAFGGFVVALLSEYWFGIIQYLIKYLIE